MFNIVLQPISDNIFVKRLIRKIVFLQDLKMIYLVSSYLSITIQSKFHIDLYSECIFNIIPEGKQYHFF